MAHAADPAPAPPRGCKQRIVRLPGNNLLFTDGIGGVPVYVVLRQTQEESSIEDGVAGTRSVIRKAEPRF